MSTFTYRPRKWDIVLCAFPDRDPKFPGRKLRPALVTGVVGNQITVVAGTSRKTGLFARRYPGEVIVGTRCGMLRKTRFQIEREMTLPYNRIWFASPSGARSDSPQIGRVDSWFARVRFWLARLELEQ